MPKKIRTKQDVANPKGIIDNFIDTMDSLRVFVRNVEPSAKAYDIKATRYIETIKSNIKDILSQNIPESKYDGSPKINKEKLEKTTAGIIGVLKEYRRLPRITTAQVEMLYKSSFVMLISFFDYLPYDIIHCYYGMHTERLPDDLVIRLSELKLCADLDEAIDLIINNKVESIIRDGLKKQKAFFKDTLQIDIKKKIINWDIINEAIERRNVIVHSNSMVDKKYLRSVNFSVVPEKRIAIKEGGQIGVTPEYFKRAYDEILITGVVLVQSCWRKWVKDDVNEADKSLINYMVELLQREEWSIAERIGLFSKDIKASDKESRLVLNINYCQSLKWQGKNAALDAELNKFDESKLEPKFMVALSALKSDKDGFYENIEKAIAKDEISQDDFDNWPLFRELRQDVEYDERIEKAFSKKKKVVKNG